MADASSRCPICGLDAPHQHSAAEVNEWRDTELWVERSLERFHEMNAAALRGDFKPPLDCGCENESGDRDPECPFCGHLSPDQEYVA